MTAAGGSQRARSSFAVLLTANAISLLGSAITIVALPLFVLSRSGSILEVAVSGFFSVAPTIIAGALGGPIVDRVGFKRMSVVADLLVGSVLILIPVLSHAGALPIGILLVLVVLRTLFDVPGVVARESLIPNIAAEAEINLDSANSLYETVPRTALLLGPVIAAALVPVIGAANMLYIDAGTFLLSAILIWWGVAYEAGEKPAPEGAADGYLAELREGFQLVRGDRLLLSLLAIVVVTNFVDQPFPALILVVYAGSVLDHTADVGVLVGATGGGTLLGTLLYGWFARRSSVSRRAVMLGSFVGVAVSRLLLIGLPGLVGAALLLFAAGLLSGPINPLLNTVVQERVPEHMRGRAFGVIYAIAVTSAPFGVLVGGLALEQLGLTATLVGAAVAWVIAAAAVATSPTVRQLGYTEGRDRAQATLVPEPASEPEVEL